MDAAENNFGDHYGTSVVSPARIHCLCFLLFVVFQQKNASEVAELLLYFFKYHDCKRRTEVLVLFFVFSEDMSSLKVFISSSVYVTIDPGTSSVVASPSCLVELLLAIFCFVFTGVFAFSLSRAKAGFLCLSKNL